jgi:hypothetical protein
MTNFAQQSEPPLPSPYRVPNAPLDLKFALMTPDQIRRFVREETIAGRHKYDDLFKAAVRVLGPESPEAMADVNPEPYDHRRVVDKIGHRWVTTSTLSLDGSYSQHCIESSTYAVHSYVTVRVPTTGWLDHAPTLDEVIEAHKAAMPIIAQAIKDREEAVAKAKAEAEQAKAAPAETPAAA